MHWVLYWSDLKQLSTNCRYLKQLSANWRDLDYLRSDLRVLVHLRDLDHFVEELVHISVDDVHSALGIALDS